MLYLVHCKFKDIEDPCCLPYKKLEEDERQGFLGVLARLAELKHPEIPASSSLLTSYRVRNKDSMSHTTNITILDKYYYQNQLPLEPLDKTAKVPHMAARGADFNLISLYGNTTMAAQLSPNL